MSQNSNRSESSPDSSSGSSNERPSISFGFPTPPSTPPSIKFNPPLSIQRRVKVHDLLKDVSKYYQDPIQSLLEVGCGGNTPLMQTLLSSDDELPLSLLSGIDIDEQLFTIGVDTAFTTVEYGGDDRWRDLSVSLIHGSFENMSLQNLGTFDAITSCEVIEHLDPGPLANFAPILLGRMSPKVLIVTTPNRDFNSLFEIPFEYLDKSRDNKPYIYDPHDDPSVAGRRYYRQPHTYAMRHHDHRFEWTRQEFQDWGNTAAEAFGYRVAYHGCGALNNGAEIRAYRWKVQEALKKHIRSQDIDIPEERDLDSEMLLEAFGHCSQVAIFIRNDQRKKSPEQLSSVENRLFTKELIPMDAIVNHHIHKLNQLPPELRLVKYNTFNKSAVQKPYPPDLYELFDKLRLSLKQLLPVEIQRIWQYSHTLEEYKRFDYKAVLIRTDLKSLWDACHNTRRACRYHLEVFEHLLGGRPVQAYEKSWQKKDKTGEAGVSFKVERIQGIPFGHLELQLEPIREYANVVDHSSYPSSDEDEGNRTLPSNVKVVCTMPIISATVVWPIDCVSEGYIPSKAFPTISDLGIDVAAEECLVLDEVAETMREVLKWKRDSESYKPPELTSVPAFVMFRRPERPEPVEEFDYEQQRRELLTFIPNDGYSRTWEESEGETDRASLENGNYSSWNDDAKGTGEGDGWE